MLHKVVITVRLWQSCSDIWKEISEARWWKIMRPSVLWRTDIYKHCRPIGRHWLMASRTCSCWGWFLSLAAAFPCQHGLPANCQACHHRGCPPPWRCPPGWRPNSEESPSHTQSGSGWRRSRHVPTPRYHYKLDSQKKWEGDREGGINEWSKRWVQEEKSNKVRVKTWGYQIFLNIREKSDTAGLCCWD